VAIRWFRWSSGAEPPTASATLAVAAADADGGGRLDDLASGLLKVVVDRVNPDEAFRVLSAMRPRTWLRLDVELRSLRQFYRPGVQWPQIIDRVADDPVALLLTACSGDGRQRQCAVQTPLMQRDQRLLPILLIRTADWVKPVREDARQALRTALEASGTDGLIVAAGVAMTMQDWQRGDFAVTAVTEALHTRSDATLYAARRSDDVRVRRLAYRVSLESGRTNSDTLVAAALTEGDIVCQRLIVDAVVRAAVRDRQRGVLDPLLAARFARVRVEALAGLAQIGHPEVGESFLADRSAMVRATAQWAMRRAGRDAAECYRAMLASGDVSLVRVAVAGLGECGVSDDAELVARYLGHERPRVRADAIRAVRRLGGPLGPTAGMLTDPAPVVVRAVADVVLGQPALVPTDRLWDLLAADQPAHVRHTAFRLLIARDGWNRIEADLWLVDDPDGQLRAHARSNLAGWLDHQASTAYQMPPQCTLERLGRLIDAAERSMGAHKAHLLRWHLGLSR
jgi:hypothetical protein